MQRGMIVLLFDKNIIMITMIVRRQPKGPQTMTSLLFVSTRGSMMVIMVKFF
jgi:hypothetical protein